MRVASVPADYPAVSRPAFRAGLQTRPTGDSVQFSGSKPIRPLKIESTLPVPILTPSDFGGNVRAAFNPGVIDDPEGGFHILARVTVGDAYPRWPFVSRIYHVFSPDGVLIEGKKTPVLPETARFPGGFEDPRITRVGRDYFIVATGYDGKLPQICMFKTRNLSEPSAYEFVGVIGPKVDDKDAFFHPEKIREGGREKYIIFHRVSETGDIQYVTFEDPAQLQGEAGEKFWKKALQPKELEKHTLMEKRPGTWENKLGGGAPPLKTKDGWLFVYHASDENGVYRGGIALLDLNDPRKVIARSPYPVMAPEKNYEKDGPVANVVFPQAAIKVENPATPDDPDIYIYYGAADRNIGLATVKESELLDYVKQFDANGNPVN